MKSKSSTLESPANKALKHYLDDLLSVHINNQENDNSDTNQSKEEHSSLIRAQKLLQQANVVHDELFQPAEDSSVESKHEVLNKNTSLTEKTVAVDKENRTTADINTKGELYLSSDALRDRLPTTFQVLLCDIAGVTIAIPLVELGSIQKLGKLSSIAGKPMWFKGVFVKGEQTYNCIDASKWLVPEKHKSSQFKECDYKFGVQLGKTPFLLCCSEVNSTIEVSKDDIEWRENPKKRLWLAGLVKKQMCALIDSETMVEEVLSH